MVDDRSGGRSLGPALAWTGRQGNVSELNLLVDADPDAALLARRARAFLPEPRIWRIDGRELVAAVPEPAPVQSELPAELASSVELFAEAGARAVVANDMVFAEVAGLEVARAFLVGHAVRVEIGVGRLDREAHEVISAHRPMVETLREVVQRVRSHRYPGAPEHPLKRLARERFACSILIDQPALVGARSLEPLRGLPAAPDLRSAWPAAATGFDLEGRPLVLVCSVGVDLDLLPMAADARFVDGRNARLVVVLPERDLHPVTAMIAALLVDPVEFVALDPVADPPW